MKAILISIKSEHILNILNVKKTLELRKTVPKDFKGWVYIYCTKQEPLLFYRLDYCLGWRLENKKHNYYYDEKCDKLANGKIAARFWFDKHDTYSIERPISNLMALKLTKDNTLEFTLKIEKDLISRSCISLDAMWDYSKKNKQLPERQRWVHAWHIDKLEVFEEPKCLSDFNLIKAPQSWHYVEVI